MKKGTSAKILVLRYRFIGDTILLIPFLRNLRRANPDACIDVLVASVSGEVIENCPYVDNFIYFDTKKAKAKDEKQMSQAFKGSFWDYAKMLRAQKYDKAYVLKRSLSSAVLAFLAGIEERIGFDTECRGFLLTKKVPYSNEKHEIECFLDVLRADGIEVKDNYLENWVNEAEIADIKGIFKEKNIGDLKKVVVHATATNAGKQWNLGNFAKVIEYLSNEKGAQVIFCGTKNDRKIYDEILELVDMPLNIEPLNLCGELNLKQSLALLKMVDLIVGVDSGNLHMASSVGTKVIGIYGPMNYQKWCAWGENNVILHTDLDCQPCGLRKKCENNRACLKNITADMVIEAIEKNGV